MSDGFVVTPQITPISFAFLISSTFAVSIKIFIIYHLSVYVYSVDYKTTIFLIS